MSYFTLSGADNDSSMWGSADRLLDHPPRVSVCQACGYKTDLAAVNPDFKVKCRQFDLSATYDLYKIASLRFMEACKRLNISGVVFTALPTDPDFFLLQSSSTVPFNAEARKTQFEAKCPGCGFYRAVAGAYPAYLLEPPSTDLAATDVVFGSGNARSRLLVVSERAKSLLAQERLRGLSFQPAFIARRA